MASLIPICTCTLSCSTGSLNTVLSWYILPGICFRNLRIKFLRTLSWIYPHLCAWLLGSFKIYHSHHATLKGRERRRCYNFFCQCYVSVDFPHHLFPFYLQDIFSAELSFFFSEFCFISRFCLSNHFLFFWRYNSGLQPCYLMLWVNRRLLTRKGLTSSF